ncbi:MAG TPA: helix-turn-helix domain-containing protein [Sandaracinaceae bacterium LLY-WYZ-13_1]|nr:helix-turn-helix domain-containing protein [Sandaracinaceae bacterium LLY-WYZ-13_1]
MPYPPEHKRRTRARIVAAASRLFRRRGFGATSVDALMGAAGLTRGGFYAHFRSKAELLEAALAAAFEESRQNLLARGLEDSRGEAWLTRAASRYLGPDHLRALDEGCAVPALGAEVSRSGDGPRRAFERELTRLIDGLATRLGGPHARARSLRALSTWVGALTLARAVHDPAFAEEILASARHAQASDHSPLDGASDGSSAAASSRGQSSSSPSG